MNNNNGTKVDSYGPFGPVFQLIPGVQSYDWGKRADAGSLVAQFAEATDELHFTKKDDQPYAEVSPFIEGIPSC